MTTTTTNLGLTTYNTITDASTVLIYNYIDSVSGSLLSSNLGIIDNFAGKVSGSITEISASVVGISASLVTIFASLINISASPIYAPYINLDPKDSIPPFSGLQVAPIEFIESSASSTNKPVIPQLRFDDTTDEGRQWRKKIPIISASYCSIKVHGRMAGSNSTKTLSLAAQFSCTIPGTTSASAVGFGGIQSSIVAVPDAANTQFEIVIPVTDSNGIVSNAECSLVLFRDISQDDAVGDFIYTGGKLQFNI